MNILFLFSDQHRGDWLPYDANGFKAMGNEPIPVKMPNVRGLMENGVTFRRAMTNSPLCVPARACLASGLQYNNCGVYNNDFCYPLKQKTFYSVLKENGYNVGGVGKFDLHKPILYWDKSGWIDQLSELGFTRGIDSEGKYDLVWSSFYDPCGPYSNYLQQKGLLRDHCRDFIRRYLDANDVRPTPLPEEAYSDNWVTRNALDMLDKFGSEDKPWFLMVNFTGPHNPWDVTGVMKEKWQDVQFPQPVNNSGDPKLNNAIRQNYAAMLDNIDHNIGLILKKLEESGELANTMIIYSADHGEMMGDNSRYLKSVPDRGALHIPLVISGPSTLKNEYCDELVQLHDLAATIVDYAGFGMPEAADAISLKGLASGITKGHRDYQVAGLFNSLKCEEDYTDYLGLLEYKKKKKDSDYIEEFNQHLNLDTSAPSMKKLDYYKDWQAVITREYKLVRINDHEYRLYNLIDDIWEQHDIAGQKPEIVQELLRLFPQNIARPAER